MEFKDEFIHRVGKIGKQWGLGEPAGRVWGVLILNTRPITQKEIAEQSGYSLSLVSPSLTILLNLGVISVTGRKGREKLYGKEITFVESFAKLVRNFVEKDVAPIISLLESNLKRVDDEELRHRIRLVITDSKNMDALLGFMTNMLSTYKSITAESLEQAVKILQDKGG